MALEETVVTGKRLKPKTGDEWYSFGGLRDAYTGREVISDPRNIEYDPNDPRESSPLTEEGSLIPSSDVSPQEIDTTLDDIDTNFSQFINEGNPAFKNTYNVNDYINVNLLTDTSEELGVPKSDVYSILYAESSGTKNYHSAAKGDLQIQKGAFIDAKVHLGEYSYNWDNNQATEDYNNLSLDDALYYGIAYIDKIQTDFKRKNGRTPNVVETAIMYTKGTSGAQSFLGPNGWQNDSTLKTYIPNVMKAYNSVEGSSPDKFAQGGTIQKTAQDFKNSLRRKDSNRFQASLREGGVLQNIPKARFGKALVEALVRSKANKKSIATKVDATDLVRNLEAEDALLLGKSRDEIQEIYELPKNQRQVQDKELAALAAKVDEDSSLHTLYKQEVDRINPIIPITELKTVSGNFFVPSIRRIEAILKSNQAKNKIVGRDISLKDLDGQLFTSRLDIPAYNQFDTWVVSLKPKQGLAMYSQGVALKNVDATPTKSMVNQSIKIAKGDMNKTPMATIEGTVDGNTTLEQMWNIVTKEVNNPNSEWAQIGFNPYRASYFYDKKIGLDKVFLGADEVIQVGPIVLAKGNIKYADRAGFNEGGTIIPRFNEGGTIFTGPDTSTPFVKKTSPAKEQREADRASLEAAGNIETLKPDDKAPVQNFVIQDGVIKSKHGTGTLSGAKVIAPEDRSWLTRETPKEPTAVLPSGSTIEKLTGRRRGIDVPAEYAAAGALGTAYGMYKLGFVGTGAAGAAGAASQPGLYTMVNGKLVPAGAAGAGAGSVGAYATTGGNIAAQVVGAGATIFSLYDMYKNGVSYENVLGAVGGAATFVAGSAAAQAALKVGATGVTALSVLGPVALGLAAALVLKDMFDKPSNKTGIAYSDLSTKELTVEGMQGDKYHPEHVDAAKSLMTPTLEYIAIMEEEYSTKIGGHIQIQVGGERGIEVIISSDDGRLYLEKDWGNSEEAVGKMYEWLDDLVLFTAETGINDLAYASAIMNDEYMYTKGYAVEHKNKYHWYQVAGRHEGNPLGLDNTRLGEYYGMAEDRTAHNTEYERIRTETEKTILAWRDYLRTVYEDLSTTTTNITPSYKNQPFPGLRKGGTIQKPKPLYRSTEKRSQPLAALQAGGMVTSPWSGGSGTIYEQPSGPTPSQDVTKGLLSPRSMATY